MPMAKQETVETTVILANVRLAFPDIFKAVQFQGEGKFSYKATFLVDPDSESYGKVCTAICQAAKNKWGAKAESILKSIEGQSQKYCWIDGNMKDYDGFAGKWALSTSRSEESGPPKVMDQWKRDLRAEDGRPYGGCYVNAKVNIWAQDNQFGRAIRAGLVTIQFAKDGDAFGGAGPATDEGFEVLADSGDDLI